ncbi:nicotinate-nucleotide diphosphorylase [Wallemia mellicola CBS 633.66]|uniref:Nicotinate-nucleotide pyrophosphorylase [carboxylating] n=1 Tax=Wallemia mellicola (strain ATCC MYA-4683 / CBS 633.66) TaxID=671144 RepID=I4YF77_WALMC|nr:nicotinate-nucleotide diphosphorylase [Wallemia mellicola CBS 633.66]EIM22619.1 nicotinate-nucleotide diphosphorylase [Wallemia mellicola CBS 633.66]|eukprot:XP_006957285.1 nicotinate-nucleotide diphosphorylase [Wallemia mellicola CBS 633.66]
MTSALHFGNPEHLLPPSWRSQVQQWLSEDTPSFDWAGFVVGEEYRDAKLLGKRKGVLAGKPFVDEIFKQLNCTIEWHVKEGESFEPIKHIATVRGAVRYLLLGERVALNVLSRCSGIASMSRWFLDTSRDAGFKGIIAGTRKTTPGFRLVEKYGMIVGGIDAHRNDLSSMVMLKDNHIWSKGSITNAIQAVRSVAGFSLRLDVEVRDEKEANEAIDAGADVIMLDNLDGEELHLVSKRLKEKWTGKRHFLLETSGGIEAHNLTERLGDNIDILSTSAVHQNVQHIDYSMKISRD